MALMQRFRLWWLRVRLADNDCPYCDRQAAGRGQTCGSPECEARDEETLGWPV